MAGTSATRVENSRADRLMIGGVGMRRGRPDPETPLPGSTLDFWRVEVYEPDGGYAFAEMRVPGRAWLEFRAEPEGSFTVLRQIAQFEPRGLAGFYIGIFYCPSTLYVSRDVEAHRYRGAPPGTPGRD